MLVNVKLSPPREGGGHTTVSAAKERTLQGRRNSACPPFPGAFVTSLFLFHEFSTSLSTVLE